MNNNKKLNLIRAITARRPYLSVDKLREGLTIWIEEIEKINPTEFAEKVYEKNKDILGSLELMVALGCKDVKIAEKCISLQFGLAFDSKLIWIREICLK